MRCARAQPVLSARLDGETVARSAAAAAEAHAATCPACTAFVERASRVRTAVRIRPAMTVPDLVEPILARLETEIGASAPPRAHRPRRAALHPPVGDASHRRRRAARPAQGRRRGGRTLAAAAMIGLVVGSVAVGGPWRSATEQPLAVASVAERVRAAAASLDAYAATYAIVERGSSPDVPERRFEVDVAFLHPQRFRMDVRDLTDYPSDAWTPNELTYIEDPPASYREGPEGCATYVHLCSTSRPTYERSTAFSAGTPLPIDLVVPIATFASTDGIRVVGTSPLGGRDAVHVVMAFERAAPLFPWLEVGGNWRPFHRRDRVDLWLDASSWFPIRTTITPSDAAERRAWEQRYGLPAERADRPILEVDAVTIRAGAPDASRFAIPTVADVSVDPRNIATRLDYVPVTPAETAGLRLVSASIPGDGGDATPRSVLVYARGLDYLRIAEHPSWRGPGPFGLPADAEEIELAGGTARFAPATATYGNRVAIHTDGTDVYLESNLTRDQILAVAASLPIRGLPLPPRQR